MKYFIKCTTCTFNIQLTKSEYYDPGDRNIILEKSINLHTNNYYDPKDNKSSCPGGLKFLTIEDK
jgi:hypothetical protein